MKIVLFGASGTIGRSIAGEALAHGHQVTAVVRDPTRVGPSHPALSAVAGDVLDPSNVATVAAGHDVVASAVGPRLPSDDPKLVVDAARSLLDGLAQARVDRLVVVGGAGSLEVAPGVQLVDTPEFPAAWKPVALAHRDALAVYQDADLDWTYISPAALIEPGERTGQYRTGTDQLLADKEGESRISVEDFAVAIVDEIENGRFLRQRMTVAY
jgi:putative NADH-flavin reductase